MSKLSQWKKILGHSPKETVSVSVAGKSEQMTQTQSYRLEELTAKRGGPCPESDRNPLQASHFTLEEAALQLMVTEREILQRAAGGVLHLYVDASNLSGRWRCRAQHGSVALSSSQALPAGFLALACAACAELAEAGTTQVTVLSSTPLTYCAPAEAWIAREGRSGEPDLFLLSEPASVDLSSVVLLPPLSMS